MSEAAEDSVRAKCLECERAFEDAFMEAVGEQDGLRLSVRVHPLASVMLELEAEATYPGQKPRNLRADLPLIDALQFARGFGSHLGSSLNKGANPKQ